MRKWINLVGKAIPRKSGNEPSFKLISLTRKDNNCMQYGIVSCPYCGEQSELRLDVCELRYRSCGCRTAKNISLARLEGSTASHQDCNGKRFYKTASGYWKSARGDWMHRYVWEYENGKLPDGYEVHHIDRNRDNNNPSNLAAMPIHEHKLLHAVH